MIVTLDFYNLNFYIKCGNYSYTWNSAQDFVSTVQYPFTDTKLLSIEPHRDIYHVQRADNTFEAVIDSAEIAWFLNQETDLEYILQMLPAQDTPVITGLVQRAQYLYDTDWLVQRHQEQILAGVTTTLSQPQIIDLLNYKQELRDLTQHYDLTQPAENISWPYNPIR